MRLQEGDGIFVSISGGVPVDFYGAAMAKLQELRLVPYVFQGVPPREGKVVSNVYLEAMAALGRCRAMVVVAGDPAAERGRNFGIDELPRAVARGLTGFSYIVSAQAEEHPEAPSGTTIHVVADPQEFAHTLEQDLRALM